MPMLKLTHLNEQALREKPRATVETAFEASNLLCSSCVELLEAPLGVQVQIRSSFRSLTRSCITCALCRIIRRGLLNANDGATDGEDVEVPEDCRLPELVDESKQTTQIWGLRQMSDHALTESCSELELMMAKGYLDFSLTTAAKHGIRQQELPWGLNVLFTYLESEGCPYEWAFQRNSYASHGIWDDIQPASSWGTDFTTAFHRARISAFPVPGELCKVLESIRNEESASTGSPGRLRLTKYWLQTCLDHHSDCEAWGDRTALLPSRVLDVGPEDGSQLPFLYETGGEIGQYVCLSHRWGGAKVLTTTTSTLKERTAAITLESMPQTFRDATLLVRSLGYRYLWIDSLCILQDQLGDWEAEAKKMGQIYRNARFTIVAAAATSADSGCFQDVTVAPLPARLPCLIGTLHLRQSCKTHASHPFNIFANVAQQKTTDHLHDRSRPPSALDSRGWVLQEEVLSARSLIFAEDGVYWECVNLAASEEFPNGDNGTYARSISPGMDVDAYYPNRTSYAAEFKRLFLRESQDQKSASATASKRLEFRDLNCTSERLWARKYQSHLDTDFADNWKKIVENYSSRHLTNEGDRIIAIRGLASQVEQSRSDEFHAGLWRSFMEQQLLWHIFGTTWNAEYTCGCLGPDSTRWIPNILPPRSLHRPPVVPTWSWARANQKVIITPPDDISEYFIRIVDVKTMEQRTGVTGPITIQGILRPILAINKRVQGEQMERYVGKVCDPSDSTRAPKGQPPVVFDEYGEMNKIAMCLPVAGLYPPGEKGRVQCLILEPTEQCCLKNRTSTLLEFRRIGLATFKDIDRPFLGLGLPLGQGGDTDERGWTKRPVIMEII